MAILLERYPYRYQEEPDRGWIEKFNEVTKKWSIMYECDSRLQLCTAMEDLEYTKWLDPEGAPCYTRSRVKAPYP